MGLLLSPEARLPGRTPPRSSQTRAIRVASHKAPMVRRRNGNLNTPVTRRSQAHAGAMPRLRCLMGNSIQVGVAPQALSFPDTAVFAWCLVLA